MKEQIHKSSVDNQRNDYSKQSSKHIPSDRNVTQKKENPFFDKSAVNPFFNKFVTNPFLDKSARNPFLEQTTSNQSLTPTIQGASPVIQRTATTAAQALSDEGVITVKPAMLTGKFLKKHEVKKSDLLAIQEELNRLREERPTAAAQNEEDAQGTEVVGADNLTILQGQLDSIKYNPTQGLLSGITHNGFQVYHIEGKYPDNGKPLWYIDDEGRAVLIGMYRHGKTNKIYKIMEGIGANTINI